MVYDIAIPTFENSRQEIVRANKKQTQMSQQRRCQHHWSLWLRQIGCQCNTIRWLETVAPTGPPFHREHIGNVEAPSSKLLPHNNWIE